MSSLTILTGVRHNTKYCSHSHSSSHSKSFKMAALHNQLFTPNVPEFFNSFLHLLSQSSAYCISGDTAEFCSRRLEEYQRTLRVMYRRLEEYRRNASQQLIHDIAQLIDIIGRRIERLETFYNDEQVIENERNQQFNVLGDEIRGRCW